MSYLYNNLETIVIIAGTISPRVYYDASFGDLSADIPARNIKNVSSVRENVEDKVGVIQLNTLTLELLETYSVSYPEGFWYTLIDESINNDYALPEFRFYLNEGAGNTYLFWGRIDPMTMRFSEKSLVAGFPIRLIEVDLIASIMRMQDVDWTTLLSTLKANRAYRENQTGTPSSLTVTFAGTPGSTVYKYRVAGRNAEGEYVWSSEAIVSDSVPVLNETGDHNILSFTGMAAASDYAIYRTYVGGGSLAVGFLGVKGSGGSGTITFNDTGFSGDAVATQSRLSAREFITPIDFTGQALGDAFEQGYVGGAITYPNQDIIVTIGGSNIPIESTYLLFWKNYATGTYNPHSGTDSPTMGYAERFNSTKSEFLGDICDTVLAACGVLVKHFAFYPRYHYDIDGTLHMMELLTRGRYGSLITMDGGVMESEQSPDTNLIPKSIRCKRAVEKSANYTPGANERSNNYPKDDGDYDLDFAALFVVQDILDATASPTHDYGNDFERFYSLTTPGITTLFTACDGAKFWDYSIGTPAYVAATGETPFAEAWVKYFQNLTQRKRKIFRRTYSTLKATLSAVSSHKNIAVMRRATINDGITTKTFYATDVEKFIRENKVSVTWIEQ